MTEPSLADALALAWDRWEEGARDRRAALHTPVIATLGLDGMPVVRTVVLRDADRATASLRFHTDARSAKVAELRREPRASLHGYDAARQYQIRVEGVVACHADDDIADEAWARMQPMSRLVYRIEPGPGSAVASSRAYDMRSDGPDLIGRDNFTVCVLAARVIETLHLASEGHVRARFDLARGKESWLAP